ncbi:ectoine synthase, partial [Pontibaca methylaminivorans]|uniref:ectoine synthase n=1 Tax=Pontibaca methylaminivorans TaxID=515897 RepID=UPI002FD95DAE
MIVRDFNELKHTDKAVSDARWTSVRMLLADDGMGFSFHITVIEAGSEHQFHYKHHFESVYCVSGRGSITDLGTGETHEIRPGVMYALNGHERHHLRATT